MFLCGAKSNIDSIATPPIGLAPPACAIIRLAHCPPGAVEISISCQANQTFLWLIGYFASELFRDLGFLWAASDIEKQTWYDKIAGNAVSA